MRVVKLCGRLACLGVFVSGGFLSSPRLFAQDADSLALPARKGSKQESASAEKSENSKKSEASTKTSAIARLSMASGSGNTYGSKSTVKAASVEKPEKSEAQEKVKQSAKSVEPAQSQKSERVEKPAPAKKSDTTEKSKEPAKSVASKKSDKSEPASSRKVETRESSSKESASDADLAVVESLKSSSNGISQQVDAASGTETDNAPVDVVSEVSGGASTEIAAFTPPPSPNPPAYLPNAYLPQAQEKRGLLSRIFNRKQDQPIPSATQSPFSSDYATRGNMVLPAVLDGAGFNGRDLPIGAEDQYRLASLPSNFRPTDLVQLPVERCHYGNQLYLRREAAMTLYNMINDAECQGLNIKVVSAYRDYGHQMRLYNKAVARGGEDQQSVARPGKSEHHLGTTVDLTNSEQHCLKRSFGDTAEGQWLAANAHRYGWKMTVMSGNGRRSHNDEPWHLRYLGSSVNGPRNNYAVAQSNSQPQSRGIAGSVKRFFGLSRR